MKERRDVARVRCGHDVALRLVSVYLQAKVFLDSVMSLDDSRGIPEIIVLKLAAVFLLVSTAWLAGCTVNTVPEPVSPAAAIQYYDLDVPADLEIKSVDFSATTFSDVSGYGGSTSSSVGGRAFVKVYAVRRKNGEQFLLLYEDIVHRKRPVQIIRFRSAASMALPDSL